MAVCVRTLAFAPHLFVAWQHSEEFRAPLREPDLQVTSASPWPGGGEGGGTLTAKAP